MGFTLLDKALWLVSFLGQLTLLGILISRKRVTRFPVFTLYILFCCLEGIVLFIIYRLGSSHTYFWSYWTLTVVDGLLQLGVVYEMASDVLRPAGRWIRDASTRFLLWGTVGAVVAACASYAVHPKMSGDLFSWSTRLDLFSSLLTIELVTVMFVSAQELGLYPRNWVMGIGRGLMIWIFVTLCVETAHSYWGWTTNFAVLDNLRQASYIVGLAAWCVSFWTAEPVRKPMTPEMLRFVKDLRTSVAYDLDSLESVQKKN
jgi:hypothetical protein